MSIKQGLTRCLGVSCAVPDVGTLIVDNTPKAVLKVYMWVVGAVPDSARGGGVNLNIAQALDDGCLVSVPTVRPDPSITEKNQRRSSVW